MNTSKALFLFLMATHLFLSGCVKLEFDEPPVGGEIVELVADITIAELKAKHTLGQFETIQEDLTMEGVVVANDQSGNYYRTLVLQDGSGGIDLRINATDLYNDYPVGRRLYIKLQGLILGDYNGLIQLGASTYQSNGFTNLSGIEDVLREEIILKGALDQETSPSVKTINELTDNDISTLIRLEDVQFVRGDDGVSFADANAQRSLNRNLEDCNGNTIILRSSGYADFAAELTPESRGSITAIYSVFRDDQQLYIRDINDIEMEKERCSGGSGNTGGPTTGLVSEDFESGRDNQDIDLSNWYNVSEKGNRLWRGKEFSGNTYAQATAYNDTNNEMVAWLITPAIDLSKASTLSFESAKAFWVHDGLSVWLSSDFNGGDPAQANWTPLEARVAKDSDADHAWIPSGDIDLSAFSGNVHIGFKYEGAGNGKTSTFRLDNISIK